MTKVNKKNPRKNLQHKRPNTNTNTSPPTPHVAFYQFNHWKRHYVNADLYNVIRKDKQNSVGVIAAIQEPAITRSSGTLSNFPSDSLIYHREPRRPIPTRAALYFSKEIHMQIFEEFTCADLAVGAWTYRNENDENVTVMVASVYMDKDLKSVWPIQFEKLINYCTSHHYQLIAMMDSNAHATLWGNYDDNTRGKKLQQLLLDNNLKIQNIGKLPDAYTYYRHNSKTIIDLTVVSAGLHDLVEDWEVNNRLGGSDHRLIQFKLLITPRPLPPQRDFKKGSWKKFQQALDMLPYTESTTFTVKKLDEEADKFNHRINTALDISHPLTNPKTKLPAFKWWDGEMDRASKRVKQAHNKWRKRRTAANHNKLKSARKDYRKTMQRIKRKSWQLFIDGHANQSDVAKYNKLLNKKNMNSLGLMKAPDTGETLGPKDSLTLLTETHFPDCKDIPTFSGATNNGQCDTANSTLQYITDEKVAEAIKSFGDYKAAGLDGFKPCVLKNLTPKAISHLTKLYTASLMLNYTPQAWRKSKVIYIPKPDKATYSVPRSHRPISLMSFLMKTLERVVLWHIQETAFKKNPLNNNQHAFRKGRSTESALTNMTEYLEASMKNGKALGVFLDIQGAFDNIKTETIIDGMKRKEIDSEIIEWYKHYLKNRSILVEKMATKNLFDMLSEDYEDDVQIDESITDIHTGGVSRELLRHEN